MIQVYGYIRVSTAGQAKDGSGLEEQRAQITAYCQENGFHLQGDLRRRRDQRSESR